MQKSLRIFGGTLLTALLLYGANLAVRECKADASTHENCLWLWLRQKLGIPPSRLGRTALLEFVGLALLAGLYLTIRYVFPFWSARRLTKMSGEPEN